MTIYHENGKIRQYRYDTKLYNTKKEALEAVGRKNDWSNLQSYYRAKKSIVKILMGE